MRWARSLSLSPSATAAGHYEVIVTAMPIGASRRRGERESSELRHHRDGRGLDYADRDGAHLTRLEVERLDDVDRLAPGGNASRRAERRSGAHKPELIAPEPSLTSIMKVSSGSTSAWEGR